MTSRRIDSIDHPRRANISDGLGRAGVAKVIDALRSLARSVVPPAPQKLDVSSDARLRQDAEDQIGEALSLVALEVQSLPAPWSLRDGASRIGSWIGLQDETERLDVARCVLESLRPAYARTSDIYLRHATTLVVKESEARGGIRERQYLIGVAVKDVRPRE